MPGITAPPHSPGPPLCQADLWSCASAVGEFMALAILPLNRPGAETLRAIGPPGIGPAGALGSTTRSIRAPPAHRTGAQAGSPGEGGLLSRPARGEPRVAHHDHIGDFDLIGHHADPRRLALPAVRSTRRGHAGPLESGTAGPAASSRGDAGRHHDSPLPLLTTESTTKPTGHCCWQRSRATAAACPIVWRALIANGNRTVLNIVRRGVFFFRSEKGGRGDLTLFVP